MLTSDLYSLRLGRLLIIAPEPSDDAHKMWRVRCDCGTEKFVREANLRRGLTKSCGCIGREKASARCTARNTKHGMTNTPTWITWRSMFSRCYQSNCKNYSAYGGRGITVCQRWRDSFENFFADMGARPNGTSIERVDNDKGYEPGNCVWATASQQNRNKRDTIKITINGVTRSFSEWCREFGISKQTAYARLAHGFTPEVAVQMPVDKRFSRQKVAA